MKEIPIIFNTEMVRALLYGNKTQTRRIVAPQPPSEFIHAESMSGQKGVLLYEWYDKKTDSEDAQTWPDSRSGMKPQYGQPGDVLWVRETWATNEVLPLCDRPDGGFIYRADTNGYGQAKYSANWKPSIHMPRAAARLFLSVKDVRVERLNDISRGDAMAEGCPFPNMADGPDPRLWFSALWDSTYHTWGDNPWVWVIEFEKTTPAPGGEKTEQ